MRRYRKRTAWLNGNAGFARIPTSTSSPSSTREWFFNGELMERHYQTDQQRLEAAIPTRSFPGATSVVPVTVCVLSLIDDVDLIVSSFHNAQCDEGWIDAVV